VLAAHRKDRSPLNTKSNRGRQAEIDRHRIFIPVVLAAHRTSSLLPRNPQPPSINPHQELKVTPGVMYKQSRSKWRVSNEPKPTSSKFSASSTKQKLEQVQHAGRTTQSRRNRDHRAGGGFRVGGEENSSRMKEGVRVDDLTFARSLETSGA
jgi:hypothetical protein